MVQSQRKEVNSFIESFENIKDRTIVIVDYGNVEKWKNSLKWKVDIKNLAQLVRKFSDGSVELRRFYYREDFEPKESTKDVIDWSRSILERAKMNRFYLIKKRVKYIREANNKTGYEKKCDMDVEMTVDLIRLKDKYDNIVIFSGDGDLMYAVRYITENFNKRCYVFGVRDHIGREVIDALNDGVIEKILYGEDFEYRLNRNRFYKNFSFGRKKF